MSKGFILVEMIFDNDQNPVDFKVIDVNPAFEKHTCIDPGKILGTSDKTTIPDLEHE